MRPIAAATAALTLLLATAPAARAGDVTEPSTGEHFPDTMREGGRGFTLVGLALRKKFIVKVYAMALYAETDAAKQAIAAAKNHSPSVFARGGFEKIGVLKFVRDVGSDKIREAFREGMEEELNAGGADVKQAVEGFIALFDRDMKKGEALKIHTFADGKVEVDMGGVQKRGPTHKSLGRAVWNIWLGKGSPTPDLAGDVEQRLASLEK